MTGSGTPRGASTWISSRGTGRRSLATPIRSSWRCSEMPPRLPGPWGRGSLIRRAPGFWLSWTAFSPKDVRSFPTVVPRRWKPRSSSCSPCARGESACWLCGVPFTGARWALWGSPSTRSTGNPGRISSVPWNTGLPKRCLRRWGRTWRRSSWNPSREKGGCTSWTRLLERPSLSGADKREHSWWPTRSSAVGGGAARCWRASKRGFLPTWFVSPRAWQGDSLWGSRSGGEPWEISPPEGTVRPTAAILWPVPWGWPPGNCCTGRICSDGLGRPGACFGSSSPLWTLRG